VDRAVVDFAPLKKTMANTMNRLLVIAVACLLSASLCHGFSVVGHSSSASQRRQQLQQHRQVRSKTTTSPSSLSMVDQQVLMGGGIAVAGLAAGIALVAFTETQGERAKERGGGLSDGMATRITGQLMEDVEVSSVDDLGSLTSQLEKALKETSGAKDQVFEMTEAEKKRIADAADDGW
jgi:hypothetical protein